MNTFVWIALIILNILALLVLISLRDIKLLFVLGWSTLIILNAVLLFVELKEKKQKKWLGNLKAEADKFGIELDYNPKIKVRRKKMSYQQAVLLWAPQTSKDNDVFKVGEYYSKPRRTYEDIVLLRYRNEKGDCLGIIEWAISQGLSLGTPYEMFAMSNEYPDLCLSFELLRFRMVETTGCLFNQEKRACCLTWNIFDEYEETIRSLELHPISDFNEQDVFFVFKK